MLFSSSNNNIICSTGVFKMPPKRLLSHYKLDAQRNRLLMISFNAEDMLLPRSNFTFYGLSYLLSYFNIKYIIHVMILFKFVYFLFLEFDSDFKLLQKQEFNIPDHLLIHDWAFTDTHYILFGNRIKLDVIGNDQLQTD